MFLDSEVGSGAVAELLSNPVSATFHLKQAKANIIKLDWKTSVEMAAARSSMSAIIDTNWLRVWEEVRGINYSPLPFLMTVSAQDAINTSPSHPPL